MRAFPCARCGQLLFFENSVCLRCGAEVGLLPSRLELVLGEGRRLCANQHLAACNWFVEDTDPEDLCRSCEMTVTRPADTDVPGMAQFAVAEAAKRRLIFQLLDLRLPIRADLRFDLLSSTQGPVTTGHDNGLITLDLAESDEVRREQRRRQLGEPYRTLLGHFRHEIGHYYEPILVDETGRREQARALFGDEREDYGEALERHYESGPPPQWAERHVSAYATMHPWEDWAETFAHYLHIRDGLETAAAFGMTVSGPDIPAAGDSLASTPAEQADNSFGELLADWLPLTYALNQLNRSIGRPDLYPFTLAPAVIDKLTFVHGLVLAATS